MRARTRSLGVLLVGALVVSACGFVGGGGTYDIVAEFPRAVSLYESGAVQVLGLPAGSVTDIEVVGDRVRVTMAIDDDIPLPADVRAALVPQSLIGERRVQLFPPYRAGQPLAEPGHEISIEDTVIPVEPDEALAALKEFLDSLDPNGIGRLIDNAATALDGQGAGLGDALDQLSQLVGNVEESDDVIIEIAERFDDFTATLLQREQQLAKVIDDFAVVADVLADERHDIELLISSLASISRNGFDLVSEHALRLRTDLSIVSRLTASLSANIDAVVPSLEGGAGLAAGFNNAFDPHLQAFNLRNSFGPLTQDALGPIFDTAGVPFPCIALPVDTSCTDPTVAGQGASQAVPASLPRPTSPIDDILELLSARTATPTPIPPAPASSRSVWSRLLGTFFGVGS